MRQAKDPKTGRRESFGDSNKSLYEAPKDPVRKRRWEAPEKQPEVVAMLKVVDEDEPLIKRALWQAVWNDAWKKAATVVESISQSDPGWIAAYGRCLDLLVRLEWTLAKKELSDDDLKLVRGGPPLTHSKRAKDPKTTVVDSLAALKHRLIVLFLRDRTYWVPSAVPLKDRGVPDFGPLWEPRELTGLAERLGWGDVVRDTRRPELEDRLPFLTPTLGFVPRARLMMPLLLGVDPRARAGTSITVDLLPSSSGQAFDRWTGIKVDAVSLRKDLLVLRKRVGTALWLLARAEKPE